MMIIKGKRLGIVILLAILCIIITNINSEVQAVEITSKSSFSDINSSDLDLAYINYLSSKGIINGYPDGSFKPEEGLTRAQAAVIMVKTGQLAVEQSAVSPFKDLKTDHWGRPYIAAAVKAGYISGFPDGTFKPDQKMTRAQGITLILKLSKQPLNANLPILNDINSQHWAAPAVAVGLVSGMVGLSSDGQNYYPEANFSRINMAHALGILLTEDPVLSASSLPGTIKSIQGKTRINKAGSLSEIELKATMTINPGDSIITEKGASAELSYPDGSSLLIKEESQLTIKEAKGRKYIKSNGQECIAVDWLNLDLKKGTMFTALATKHENSESPSINTKTTSYKKNNIASLNGMAYIAAASQSGSQDMPWYETSKTKKVKIKVDMPWGVAAVRGTFIMISIASNGQASVSCLTGSAEVSNGGQTVSLGQNQSTEVNGATAPPPVPEAIPAAVVQLFEQVKAWIEETAKTMDQNQEQIAPAPPPALIAALKEVLTPIQQQTKNQIQQQTVTNPVNNAVTALQAINQALGGIGINVGNNAIAFQTPATNSLSNSSGGSSTIVSTTDLNANQITLNTVVGIGDNIRFTGLADGTIVKVYDAATAGSEIAGTLGAITAGAATFTFAADLGSAGKNIWVTATSALKLESAKFAIAAVAEPVALPIIDGSATIIGTAKYGQTLTADISQIFYTPATQADQPSYQWQRDEIDISGATGANYMIVAADIGKTITVKVSADGTHATGHVISAATAAVALADGPAAPAAPSLASKTYNSITLTANAQQHFSKDGGNTWQASEVFTNLSASTEYTFTARIKASATNHESAASASTVIETNDLPIIDGSATIIGTAKCGQILTVDTSQIFYTPATETVELSYWWRRDGIDIDGATGASYTIVEADIGKSIAVRVSDVGINVYSYIMSDSVVIISDVTTIKVKVDHEDVVTYLNEDMCISVAAGTTVAGLIAAIESTDGSNQIYVVTESEAGNVLAGDVPLVSCNLLEVTAEDGTTSANYTITVLQALPQVGKPEWGDGLIHWACLFEPDSTTPIAASYYVILYKDDSPVATHNVENNVENNVGMYDFPEYIFEEGSYTATVQAIGDGINYSDGPVSEVSDVHEIPTP